MPNKGHTSLGRGVSKGCSRTLGDETLRGCEGSGWAEAEESLLFPFLFCFGFGGARDVTGALCILGNVLPLFWGSSHAQPKLGFVDGNANVMHSHNSSTQEVGAGGSPTRSKSAWAIQGDSVSETKKNFKGTEVEINCKNLANYS